MNRSDSDPRRAGLAMVQRVTGWLAAGSLLGTAAVAGIVAHADSSHARVTTGQRTVSNTTPATVPSGSNGESNGESEGGSDDGATATTPAPSQQFVQPSGPVSNFQGGGGQVSSGGS